MREDDGAPLATLAVTVFRGAESGSIRVQQEGTGNVLLRFEALIAAASQLLQTALTSSVSKPEAVDADLVAQTLAGYVTGSLDPNAENLVMVALDALSPREAPPADEADEDGDD